jgi:hypothetical protein
MALPTRLSAHPKRAGLQFVSTSFSTFTPSLDDTQHGRLEERFIARSQEDRVRSYGDVSGECTPHYDRECAFTAVEMLL